MILLKSTAINKARKRSLCEGSRLYVIKLWIGYWVGTLNEWTYYSRNRKKIKHFYPPVDCEFQTK